MERKFFLLLAIIALSPVILVGQFVILPASGDIIASIHCTPDQLEFNQYMYREHINGINDAIRLYLDGHPHYARSDLSNYMTKLYAHFQPVPEYAQCLREMGINPSSIAHLSNGAVMVLVYDAPEIERFVPNFMKNVPILGFTSNAAFPRTPIPITHEPGLSPNCNDTAFPTVNWSFCNFSGSDLGQSYLMGANLTGTVFVGSNLTRTYAFDAILRDADLDHSDISHTELAGVDLSNASLIGANMTFSSLDLANLTNTTMANSSLAKTHGLLPIFYNANLSNANLADTVLIYANFKNADLSGANLTNADLSGSNLQGANLTNADLTGTILTRVNLHCVGNFVCVH